MEREKFSYIDAVEADIDVFISENVKDFSAITKEQLYDMLSDSDDVTGAKSGLYADGYFGKEQTRQFLIVDYKTVLDAVYDSGYGVEDLLDICLCNDVYKLDVVTRMYALDKVFDDVYEQYKKRFSA